MKTWIILSFAFCAGVWGLLTFPLLNEVQDLRLENQGLENILAEKEAKTEELEEIKVEFADRIKNIQAQIPLDSSQENFIRDLRKITTQTGFSFSGIKFSRGQNSQINAPHLIANFSARGDRSNVKNLLALIEQNERFLGMDSLSVSTIESANKSVTNLTLSVYALYQE